MNPDTHPGIDDRSRARSRGIVALMVLVWLLIGAFDQLPAQSWLPHRPVTSPSARMPGQLAYDPLRDSVILFGGWDGAGNLGDTWEYDGQTWYEIFPAASPSPRHGHNLVFDPNSGTTILFGGTVDAPGGGYEAVNDTWSWDGFNWTLLQTIPGASAPPAPRNIAGMAYFPPLNRVILYGGQEGSFNFFEDQWAWDGSSWQDITPITSTPGKRSQMGFAFDPLRQRLVLAGGHSYPPRLFHNDTWEFDGSSWTLSAATPFPIERSGVGMAFAPNLAAIVMMGGYTDPGPLGDCWAYDGTQWTNVPVHPDQGVREFPGMVEDTTRERALMFGGSTRVARLNDLWTLGDLVPATFTTHGSGCGGTGGVPVLSSAAPPWAGELLTLDLSIPAGASGPLLAIGQTAAFPLPIAPGCDVFIDVLAPYEILPLPASGGTASLTVFVHPILAGVSFEVQGVLGDPTAALGLAISNGATLVIR